MSITVNITLIVTLDEMIDEDDPTGLTEDAFLDLSAALSDFGDVGLIEKVIR